MFENPIYILGALCGSTGTLCQASLKAGLSEILCKWFGVMLRLSGWGVEMITYDEGTSEALDSDTGEVLAAENDFAAIAEELVAAARGQGIELTGPNGLLTGLTRQVLQTALEVEMADHLGYDKHDPVGRNERQALVNTWCSECVTAIESMSFGD